MVFVCLVACDTVVNTSSVPDLEAQVSQMEKALSLGSLEPNLAGEMVNRVSKLLHSPLALLAPLAQRYESTDTEVCSVCFRDVLPELSVWDE